MKTLSLFDAQGWKEVPDYPHEQWQEEVGEGSTVLGYAAWLVARHEEDGKQVKLTPDSVGEAGPDARFLAQHADQFPIEQWREEVADLNTRLGYGAWVAHQVEMGE